MHAYAKKHPLYGRSKPDHTRLRKLVSMDFTPNKLERMRPRIQEITDKLLSGAAQSGSFDVAKDLAEPLPVMVIAELLGIPSELAPQFKKNGPTRP